MSIQFNKVLKSPESWCDSMNVDIMMENHTKLASVIDKMFFTEWPKNPKLFSMIFSKEDFADKILNGIVQLEIINLNRIWFTEYSMDDKKKLVKLGILEPDGIENGIVSLIFTKSANDCFVNVFA